MPKYWFNLKLAVRPQHTEKIEQWFFAQGAIAVTQEKPKELYVFESQVTNFTEGQLIGVVGLFDENIDTSRIEADLNALGFDSVQLESIDDENWERAWLNRFKPACFGNRLWVVPTETEFDFTSFVKSVSRKNTAVPKYIRDNWTIVLSIRNQLENSK